MDCLFCKIIRKEIPTKILFENNSIMAFEDINPQAPIHLLFIPKVHISSLSDINKNNIDIINNIFISISEFCNKNKIVSYRIINNCGEQAGQTVNHIHFHLLSGRTMKWPPG